MPRILPRFTTLQLNSLYRLSSSEVSLVNPKWAKPQYEVENYCFMTFITLEPVLSRNTHLFLVTKLLHCCKMSKASQISFAVFDTETLDVLPKEETISVQWKQYIFPAIWNTFILWNTRLRDNKITACLICFRFISLNVCQMLVTKG